MKRLASVFLSLFLIFQLFTFCVFAKENFIIVPSGFASQQTLSQLEFKAENIYNAYGFKAYFIMNDDVKANGAYKAATEFYFSNVKENGIVFCLDSDSGSAYIYGGDDFSESELNSFMTAYTTVEGGTYGDRIGGFLDKFSETVKKHIGGSEERSERLMPRFMDNAEVIENEKESAIYTDIDNFSEKKKSDVVFVTYSGSEKPKTYGESFYEKNNYGFGETKSGVILAVNTSSGEIYLSAKGRASSLFSRKAVENLASSLCAYSEKGDYINLFISYLDGLDKAMNTTDYLAEPEKEDVSFPALPDNAGENGEIMPRLYDGAKIIDSESEKEINMILDEVSSRTGLDFVAVTIHEIPDAIPAGDYANMYFEHFDFGFGDKKNGVLLLISFDPEYCFLSAFGDAEKYFGKGDLKKYTESFYSLYKKENYNDAVRIYALEAAKRLMTEKLELPLAVTVVLFVVLALVLTVTIVSKKKKQREETDSEYINIS